MGLSGTQLFTQRSRLQISTGQLETLSTVCQRFPESDPKVAGGTQCRTWLQQEAASTGEFLPKADLLQEQPAASVVETEDVAATAQGGQSHREGTKHDAGSGGTCDVGETSREKGDGQSRRDLLTGPTKFLTVLKNSRCKTSITKSLKIAYISGFTKKREKKKGNIYQLPKKSRK